MEAYEVIGYLICRHRQNLPLTDFSESGSIQLNEDIIKCSKRETLLSEDPPDLGWCKYHCRSQKYLSGTMIGPKNE
jgi:hypothetical protein